LAPLLPARARRPAAIAVACCAVVVAVLGAFAAGRTQGNAIDRPVDSWLRHQLASHIHVLSDISYLGGGQISAVLTAILVLGCLLARRVNGAVLALVSVVVAAGLTEFVFKPLVHETINGSLTYPSGHTTSLFALIGVVGVLLLNPPRQRPRPGVRVLLMACLVAIGCIVAVALVGLNYHYFTDTIAGAALGGGVALAATFPLDRTGVRRRLAAALPRRLKPEPPA
jgi:membrane-associated phospholipid phosphatase